MSCFIGGQGKEIHRYFSCEKHSEIADESTRAGWQNDCYTVFRGLTTHHAGKRQGCRKHFVKGQYLLVLAVNDAIAGAMLLEPAKNRVG
jgi:hypothetical protein